jgi:hypothetical protein
VSRFRAEKRAFVEPKSRSSSQRIRRGVVKLGDRFNSAYSRRETPLPVQANTTEVRRLRFELQYAFVHGGSGYAQWVVGGG